MQYKELKNKIENCFSMTSYRVGCEPLTLDYPREQIVINLIELFEQLQANRHETLVSQPSELKTKIGIER